ncbi:MAG: DUF3024 domain-containing protein [Halopseudomonas sp.]|uniref:DUF3024 domain-containing protein n=1 Tax=Halopseudomonas sp. TaxID=2901191 RepID=UPI0030036C06
MAFSELAVKQIERAAAAFLEARRPPAGIRHQVDLQVRINEQSVEIVELRPHHSDLSKAVESPTAKAEYVNETQRWRVYWMPSDLEWHSYEPQPEVKSVDAFFALVNADENACFFG